MPRSRLLVRIAAAAAILSGGALTPLDATASAQAGPSYVSDPASLVNPIIGTANGGDVFPGADVPFGMVQWSPDTPTRPAGGGYEYNDTIDHRLQPHPHLGAGLRRRDDVPILPTTGRGAGRLPAAPPLPLDHTPGDGPGRLLPADAAGVNTTS